MTRSLNPCAKLKISRLSESIPANGEHHTLETAISKAYSVINALVLLEKYARIPITATPFAGLDNLKEMLTEVFDTISSLVLGKVPSSSGSAEVKSQSSSADAPLLCRGGLGCTGGELEG